MKGAGIQRRASSACYRAMLWPMTPKHLEFEDLLAEALRESRIEPTQRAISDLEWLLPAPHDRLELTRCVRRFGLARRILGPYKWGMSKTNITDAQIRNLLATAKASGNAMLAGHCQTALLAGAEYQVERRRSLKVVAAALRGVK